jgi:hypothetical protein
MLFVGPVGDFVFRSFLCLRDEACDVGERRGAARGDAVGSKSVQELREKMMDGGLGDKRSAGRGDHCGKIVFAKRLGGDYLSAAEMVEAKALSFGGGREGGSGVLWRIGKRRDSRYRPVFC